MEKPVLYHNDMSVCSAKVRMALAEKHIIWEEVHLDIRAGDAQRPEYVKLNPNQVVPTLVHHGMPIIESNIICEFIEDHWPSTALRPAASSERAVMRLWMKQLDDGMHAATGVVSTCVAFRHQHLARKPEDYQAWLANMVDTARRERLRSCVEQGLDSPFFIDAVKRFNKLIADFETALEKGPWLAGPDLSLADIAYAPYMLRLQHLGLDEMFIHRPRVSDWAKRLMARPAFEEGISKWVNPNYLLIFNRESQAARAKVKNILSHLADHPNN